MFKRLCLVFALTSSMSIMPAVADQRDDEIAALKMQVQLLRAENQALRLQLGRGGAQTKQDANQPPAAETPAGVRQAPSEQQAEQSYWITTSSRKRHNSSCRYYKTSKGRACTKDEGIPCKICGG